MIMVVRITKSHARQRASAKSQAGTRRRKSLRVPALTTYVNVLSVILVPYHFILLRQRFQRSRGKEGKRRPRRREEGPAFQSPVSTRDPRPLNHPPQLGRNSVLFSPPFPPRSFFFHLSTIRIPVLLCFLYFILSLISIYPPPLFRPFLPDHGDNLSALPLLVVVFSFSFLFFFYCI